MNPERKPGPGDDLAGLALLYASGEMSAKEAALFEDRLAAEQLAREALTLAVGLLTPIEAGRLARPRTSCRRRVLSFLRPRRTGRRSFTHSLACMLGGAAAAVLFLLIRGPAPELTQGLAGSEPALESSPGLAAVVYSDLSNINRLVRVRIEQNQRRNRQDEGRGHPPALDLMGPEPDRKQPAM
jgi:hypothetical protein